MAFAAPHPYDTTMSWNTPVTQTMNTTWWPDNNTYFWQPQPYYAPDHYALPDLSKVEFDRMHLARARGVVWLEPAYKISVVSPRVVLTHRLSRDSTRTSTWVRRGGKRPLRGLGR